MSLSNADLTREERLVRSLHVQATKQGGDPSMFLELLADAVQAEAWTKLPTPVGFRAFVETGIGCSVEMLEAMVNLRHRYEGQSADKRERMEQLRARVKDLLNDPLGTHGGTRPIGQGDIHTLTPRGDDPDYILARLKRDRGEDDPLVRQVVSGEVSARRAAVQSGIRKPRWSAPTDPVALARAIRRRLAGDDLAAFLAEMEAG